MTDKQNSQSDGEYSGKHVALLQPATAKPLVRHEEEIRAAKMIADPVCYSAFYVDKGAGSTLPFRGALGHSIQWAQLNDKKKARRIARVDRMGLSAAHQRLCGAGWAGLITSPIHSLMGAGRRSSTRRAKEGDFMNAVQVPLNKSSPKYFP